MFSLFNSEQDALCQLTLIRPLRKECIMTTKITQNTVEQYRALQCLPSPKQLFDFEIESLVTRRLARYEHADSFRKKKPHGLFLFVPPKPRELDLNNLVSLIEYKEKKGRNYLDPQRVHDEIEVHEGPYLMLDVEDGKTRRYAKSSVSKASIIQEGRSPWTTWRGLIHAILFPEVLQRHNMVLVGSRYESEYESGESESPPYLCLYEGEPRLEWYPWYVYAFPGWGVPSCGGVIIGA